jgi:outer membrane protein assembly factor BamD
MTPMRQISLALLVLVLTLGLLAGCGAKRVDPTRDWSASQLYTEARAALDRDNFDQAVEYYESLEARYPFSRFAQQAQLEVAYAYYKADEPDMALAAADRFIQINPRHPYVDYAYFLKGLVNARRHEGFMDRWFTRDARERDPEPLRQAFEDFGTLVRNFPDSRYADDARQRMIHLRNVLAGHELYVAEFYMRRGAWLAAAQRARTVVERYHESDATLDALEMMVRAYRELELDDLADDALRVLEANDAERAARLRGT